MASYTSNVLFVRHSEPQLVVPAKHTPSEVKEVSDTDAQEALRMHLSLIMFYKSNPNMKQADPAKVIKSAISHALVPYYPLAGRLIQGPSRKLMVDCSAEGVLFVEADADVTLEQLGDSIAPPCPHRKEFLYQVPGSEAILGCPLLLIQFLNRVGTWVRDHTSPFNHPCGKEKYLTHEFLHASLAYTTNTRMSVFPTTVFSIIQWIIIIAWPTNLSSSDPTRFSHFGSNFHFHITFRNAPLLRYYPRVWGNAALWHSMKPGYSKMGNVSVSYPYRISILPDTSRYSLDTSRVLYPMTAVLASPSRRRFWVSLSLVLLFERK